MTLWSPSAPTSLEIDAEMVDLHDSDILKFKEGPLTWARAREGRSLDIDQFCRDLAEQFHKIGFGVEVQVWDTKIRGAYTFNIVIQKRIDSEFDPDRQVHEVVNNILELPGEEKGYVIDTGKAIADFERERRERGKRGSCGH